jgi:hypothetical protein
MVYDISVLVRETGAVVHATESEWCRVREIQPEREWIYGFEEMKGQPTPDYDYNEPVLHVEKRDGRLQLTIKEYHGRFHVDLFAFNRLIWRNVGGPERRHVGASLMVELPEVAPAPPAVPPVPPTPPVPEVPPPAPPEAKPIADRLDIIISWIASFKPLVDKLQDKLQEIKAEMETYTVRANTYSVVTIDLGTERSTLTEYTVGGFAMTVFKCTGTMDLQIGDVTTDVITIEPLTYPEMIVIDSMEFTRFFVRNAAQAGKEAVLIVWRRE